MRKPVRVAVVTDVHHNPVDRLPGICSMGIPLLRETLERCSGLNLVDLGDRIDDKSPEIDRVLGAEVGGVFRHSRLERFHLMGNHDSYSLSRAEWANALDRPVESGSAVIGDYRLLFFSADVNNGRSRDYCLQAEEIEWLARELERDDRPTVVFTHVPLLAGSLAGNYYFQDKPGRAVFANANAARAVLERAGNVVLVVSGHVHWNTWMCCNGLHYVTLQSLTESFTTNGKAACAYAVLEIDDCIKVQVFGADPLTLCLPLTPCAGLR